MGVKPGSAASCPKPLGPWAASEIFKTAPAGYALEDVCVYTFSGGGPVSGGDLVSLQALVTSGDLLEVERDLMALGSSGSGVDETLWRPLADYFLEQAGGGELQTLLGRVPVRLAVLDTHPTAELYPLDRPANSEHGRTLIAMAERLLCGGLSVSAADCVAQITSRLALPYVSYDANDPAGSVIDLQYGGYVGTLTDLAAAIQMEVADWERNAIPDQALVLNLSVGWNPDFGGLEADPANMSLPARLVFDAIADATCRGAVVVAATGNRNGGPDSGVGPMLPAAWASRSLPEATRCDGAMPEIPPVPADTSWFETEHPPLLYAAGGIQGNGATLSNSRPSSVPARVALGDHGVVTGPEIGTPTAILTGSSVSSLVVSAAAAAAWYYAPQVSPHQVMQAVDSSGEVLGLRANFCHGPAPYCPMAEVGAQPEDLTARVDGLHDLVGRDLGRVVPRGGGGGG
ncbi:MAG: S8 family serine peptidase, partial [Acidobacteriota bacterium]